jgi:hypothetical protein
MKARRDMAFRTGKGASMLRLQGGGIKRVRPSSHANLFPITPPFSAGFVERAANTFA